MRPKTSQLKTAVVGAGNMGKNHIRIYSEISDLVAIVDTDKNQGEKLAKQFKTKYFPSLEQMFNNMNPEAISVVVPTEFHSTVVQKTLAKKIPTLVEKPIAATVNEAALMLAAAKKNNTLLMVGHIERFNPAVKKTKQILDKNELGEIISISARRVGGLPASNGTNNSANTSITTDLAIHDIDIINYLLDETPTRTTSQTKVNSVDMFLQYKTASAFIQANWITPVKIRKLNITGTQGYLELDYISQKIHLYKNLTGEYEKYKQSQPDFAQFIAKFSPAKKQTIHVTKKEPLKEELKFFLEAVAKKTYHQPQYAVDALKIALSKT